jgi:hypothetical protein
VSESIEYVAVILSSLCQCQQRSDFDTHFKHKIKTKAKDEAPLYRMLCTIDRLPERVIRDIVTLYGTPVNFISCLHTYKDDVYKSIPGVGDTLRARIWSSFM